MEPVGKLDVAVADASPRRASGSRRAGWSVNVLAIERQRILRGWTQRQLARHARVHPDTLTDLFAERRRPTFGTVQAICSSLNLTLADVIVFDAEGSRGPLTDAGGTY